MITARALLGGGKPRELLGAPEMDPLTERGALQDAQLIEVAFDATSRRLGWLFDLRMAYQLRMANTALLICEGVDEFSWLGKRRPATRIAWPVDDSIPDNKDGILRIKLLFYHNGETEVTAHSASFYTANVPGLSETPPDFISDSDDVIAAGMASMDSRLELAQAAFVEPGPKNFVDPCGR
jgi:hypothetical protein